MLFCPRVSSLFSFSTQNTPPVLPGPADCPHVVPCLSLPVSLRENCPSLLFAARAARASATWCRECLPGHCHALTPTGLRRGASDAAGARSASTWMPGVHARPEHRACAGPCSASRVRVFRVPLTAASRGGRLHPCCVGGSGSGAAGIRPVASPVPCAALQPETAMALTRSVLSPQHGPGRRRRLHGQALRALCRLLGEPPVSLLPVSRVRSLRGSLALRHQRVCQ